MTTERPKITLNHATFEWNLADGDVCFFGISSVLFWANPSLYRMLAPLVDEVGPELFRLLVAYSSSHGTDEDYDAMVTKLGSTFEEGFVAWGRAVGSAGWGAFELPEFDRERGRAVVRVRNPSRRGGAAGDYEVSLI
jgi:rsbT co-antagonist protein RsbR